MSGLERASWVFLLFSLTACAACAPSAPSAPSERPVMSAADDPTTLIVGVPDDAATFDGVFATTPRSVGVIMNTYETLMTNSWKGNDHGLQHWVPDKVEGAALASMSVADDGVTWTLEVREGVRFPSGDAVTAEAVKGVFDRNFGVKGSGGAFLYRSLGRIPGPAAVDVIDRDTVRITTDRPNPLLPRLLILSNGGLLDPTLVRSHSEPGEEWAESWLRQNTAGAGAYFVESWTRGVEIVLRANKNYWRGAPAIDKVVMKIIPSAADRMMLLVSGYLDVVERLSAEENDAVARVPGVRVLSLPSTQAVSLVMHCQLPPFDDIRVRRAMSYAVPYEGVMRDVYFGRAQATAGPVPVGFPGHDPGDYPFGKRDPQKAKALLASAGYPEGFSVDLELDSGVPEHEAIAVFLQSAFKEVGVEATIVKLTPAVFAEQRASRTLRLFLDQNLWWVDDPIYPLWFGYVSGAFLNHGSYSNSAVDEMVNRAVAELEPGRRRALLGEAQRKIIEDAAQVWITQPDFLLATKQNVDGYVHFNDQVVRFQYLSKK